MFLTFTANQTQTESLQGNIFYFKGGTSTISVRGIMGGETKTYTLEPGMGIRLRDGRRFQSLEINSPAAQTIEIEVNDEDVFDNRAVISLSGAMPVSIVSGGAPVSRVFSRITLAAGAAQKILNTDTTRLKTSMYFSAATFLGPNGVSAATGYPIAAGSDLTDENTYELWAISSVGGTIDMMVEGR